MPSTVTSRDHQRNNTGHETDMIPVSFSHNLGVNRRQSYPARRSRAFKADPRFDEERYQEDTEPIGILSSLKHQFREMAEQETSLEQDNRQQRDVAVVQPSFAKVPVS